MLKQVATIAERLGDAMAARDMRQIDLANAAGIYVGTINNYLKGKYSPKKDKLEVLARALGVSPVWLMGLDVPMVDEEQELSAEAQEIAAAYDKLNEESRALVRRMLGLPY